MKKFILLVLMLLIMQPVFAYNYSNLCAPKPYPVGNSFTRFFSNATGTNFFITKIAEMEMQKALKKDIGSNFNVEIIPYGAKDFINGKFKTMHITSPRVSYAGLIISDFSADTVCDYNQVALKGKEIYFAQNLVMKYSATITNDNLKAMTLTKEYMNILNKMSISYGTNIIFKIFSPDASIVGDRLKFKFKIIMPFFLMDDIADVTVDAGLKIQNEKLVFTDIKLGSDNNRMNLSYLLPLINKMNPFMTEFNISKNTKGIFKVKNVKIENNRILIDGLFLVPKNYS